MSHLTLALLTSGGDAPGMNAALAWLNRLADQRGWRTLGIREGFAGLLRHDAFELHPNDSWRRARHGSTLLGSSRLATFTEDLPEIDAALEALGITSLVVLGGNGSMDAAAHLAGDRRQVIGLPATIDNDVPDSEATLGFDTAVNTGVRMLDGIRDAGEALPHLFALEVLGGNTGFLAHAVAEAGGADLVLVPEMPLAEEVILKQVEGAMAARRYAIIVTAEGYPDVEGVIARASAAVGKHPRFGRIGHAQRGGAPSGRDRKLALEFSLVAIEALATRQSGRLVWRRERAQLLPFADPGSKVVRKAFTATWKLPL
ncbi:MAG: 6-phosphofructokinase [Trueperaceae bacterium]|nr:MAG: 6-phosphofructokinase [Trueperaceae bacterium]